MKTETMRQKILDMIDGKPVKLRKGGQYDIISPKQSAQLFNLLHREFNAARMGVKRIDDRTARIHSSEWEGKVIFDCIVAIY